MSYSDAVFGQGSGPIFLNNVICTGDEMTLLDCSSDPIGMTGSCTHEDDAGVQCRSSKFNTQSNYEHLLFFTDNKQRRESQGMVVPCI